MQSNCSSPAVREHGKYLIATSLRKELAGEARYVRRVSILLFLPYSKGLPCTFFQSCGKTAKGQRNRSAAYMGTVRNLQHSCETHMLRSSGRPFSCASADTYSCVRGLLIIFQKMFSQDLALGALSTVGTIRMDGNGEDYEIFLDNRYSAPELRLCPGGESQS